MNRKSPKLIPAVLMLLVFTGSAIPGSSVHALVHAPKNFKAGTWSGIFFFTLTHSFSEPDVARPVNDFSLIAEGQGSIQFKTRSDGGVQGTSVTIPGFDYGVAAQLEINTDDSCKGYVAHGGGKGNANSGAAALVPNLIESTMIRLNAGEPWGFATPIGDCEGSPPSSTFKNAVKMDFNALSASPWVFTVTAPAIPGNWMAGTCTTESWQTANRAIECYWSVFRH